jgi:hypothetical protein
LIKVWLTGWTVVDVLGRWWMVTSGQHDQRRVGDPAR